MPSPLPPVLRMVRLRNTDVLAIGGVQAPHQTIVGGEILEAQIAAADGLDQRRMAERILRVRPSAECGIADDLARADDADVLRVDGVDQADVAGNPFAFPAHLRDRIIGEIGRAANGGVLFQPEGDVRTERDRAREIISRRNHHLAAAEHVAAVDGLLDGGGVLGGAIAGCAEFANVQTERGTGCRALLRGQLPGRTYQADSRRCQKIAPRDFGGHGFMLPDLTLSTPEGYFSSAWPIDEGGIIGWF